MSESVRPLSSMHDFRIIKKAKKDARSDLEATEWQRQGWVYSAAALNAPRAIGVIGHESALSLSVADFLERYERPNLPVLISDIANEWSAKKNWTLQALYDSYRHLRFRVGEDDKGRPVKVKLKYFLRYLASQRDDSPLYIFDSMVDKVLREGAAAAAAAAGSVGDSKMTAASSATMTSSNSSSSSNSSTSSGSRGGEGDDGASLASKKGSAHQSTSSGSRSSLLSPPPPPSSSIRTGILSDYALPPYFREDLFSFAGEARRPPYRWFLIGPIRSGTKVHIDPLATSAWNTLITGRKRWVLFPPHFSGEVVNGRKHIRKTVGTGGGIPEDDESIDYFNNILPRIKKEGGEELVSQMIEVVQEEGETIFVPSGWWHAVLNLTDTIAVTQNFCSTTNFERVWLATRQGRRGMARRWLKKLATERPDLAVVANALNRRDGWTHEAASEHHRKRKEIDRELRKARRRIAVAKKRVKRLQRKATASGVVEAGDDSSSSESSSCSSSSSSGSGSQSSTTSSSSGAESTTSSDSDDDKEETAASKIEALKAIISSKAKKVAKILQKKGELITASTATAAAAAKPAFVVSTATASSSKAKVVSAKGESKLAASAAGGGKGKAVAEESSSDGDVSDIETRAHKRRRKS